MEQKIPDTSKKNNNNKNLFLALPNITTEILKKINTLLFKFLWDNKPDKIKETKQHYLPIAVALV